MRWGCAFRKILMNSDDAGRSGCDAADHDALIFALSQIVESFAVRADIRETVREAAAALRTLRDERDEAVDQIARVILIAEGDRGEAEAECDRLRAERDKAVADLIKLEDTPINYWKDKRVELERFVQFLKHGKDEKSE